MNLEAAHLSKTGLRHLAALRTITEGPTVVFQPSHSVWFIGLPILLIGRANSNSAPHNSFSAWERLSVFSAFHTNDEQKQR